MPDELDDGEVSALEARRREAVDLAAVLGTPEGRRVLRRVIYDLAGVLKLGWAGADRHHTDFHAGARNLGLLLLSDARRQCPTLARMMEAEHEASVNQGDQRHG